jgi:hypothetical protein
VSILLHLNRDISADKVLESLLFHVNPILAREQVHEGEQTVAAAGLRALFRSAQVRQGHFSVGNDGA